VNGLANTVRRQSGRIYTGTHAAEIHDKGELRVVTPNGLSVTAKAIVVATNTPINDRVAIHTKQAPYRTFVTSFRVPIDAMRKALYWDTSEPYHYVRWHRVDQTEASLIVGGEDHKTGHCDDAGERFRRLEAWTRRHFPEAGRVEHQWSGQVLEPFDGVAFIGRNPGSTQPVYIATGDSGQGITHGVIAGMLIRDLIMQRDNDWARLYDPSRKTLRAVKTYAKINTSVAGRYTDWFKKASVSSIREVEKGSGAVIHRGTRRLAVYRADDGSVSVCSAVCTHLGCVVQWNGSERSWDCPCHGSRFSPTGEVLNGPAIHPLKRLQIEEVQPEPDPRDEPRPRM
jgi:Rieske Fe-S protein